MANRDFDNDDFDRATGAAVTDESLSWSNDLGEVAGALAKAQHAMVPAHKDARNDFYKSKYADLADVQKACMPFLNEHGISVVSAMKKQGPLVIVTLALLHSSGQWLRGTVTLTPKKVGDLHAEGGAFTYGRRYLLAAMAGVLQEDDDGNRANDVGAEPKKKPADRSAAAKKAAETRKRNAARPQHEVVVDAFFKKLALGKPWVEAVLGKPAEEMTEEDVAAMRGHFDALAAARKSSEEEFSSLCESLIERAGIQEESAA